ncbi:hypothetical protein RM545_07360 [Zunongwangia sp. F260]|uniref:Uncharacterized protein n=1 Tax=Autumnicola lenta TaxID=3075593 RepID=A0ABU3CJH0_9FLAO|nr:hypothetical protein [Zunongwangia sp. F260]MDT0646502.1 hypothetical protein [Zunongwangia sp. F260]
MIIELYKQMLKEREYVLSKQLLRGGIPVLELISRKPAQQLEEKTL